jgi:hypothetical protein
MSDPFMKKARSTGKSQAKLGGNVKTKLYNPTSEQLLAGFLGLPDTGAFRAYVYGPKFEPPYLQLVGISQRSRSIPRLSAVIKLVQTQVDRKGYRTPNPDTSGWLIDDHWAQGIVNIIALSDADIAGNSVAAKFPDDSYSDQNINRVWKTIIWRKKKDSPSRKAKTNRRVSRPSIIPQFMQSPASQDPTLASDETASTVANTDIPSEIDTANRHPSIRFLWKNRATVENSDIRVPPAVQDLINPLHFSDVRHLRDRVRLQCKMELLGVDIKSLSVVIGSKEKPANEYEELEEIEIVDNYPRVQNLLMNEEPSWMKWYLETASSNDSAYIYEAPLPAGFENFQDGENDDQPEIDPATHILNNKPNEDEEHDPNLDDVDLMDPASIADFQGKMLIRIWNQSDIVQNTRPRKARIADLDMVNLVNAMANVQAEMDEEDEEGFWRFQSSRLNIDCLGPELSCSLKDLEFPNPIEPRVGSQQGDCLLPFQVTGLRYLVEHERGPFPISEQFGPDVALNSRKFAYFSSLVADDPGLGKTVMALALVAWTALHPLPDQINKPTLVVCPGGVVDHWIDEIELRFPMLDGWIYHGSNSGTDGKLRQDRRILSKDFKDLPDSCSERFQHIFDLNNERARFTVIITTAETLASRSLSYTMIDDKKSGPPQSRFKGLFARMILDEAHKFKNVNTLNFDAVALLECPYRVLLTATPMINSCQDLHGLLSLIWRDEWLGLLRDGDKELCFEDTEYDVYEDCDENDPKILCCLHPAIYQRLIKYDKDGKQDLVRIRNALPRIFKQVQIRRTIASEIRDDSTGRVFKVGDKIPLYWISTVELRQTLEEKQEYQEHHRTLVKKLAKKLKVSATRRQGVGGVQGEVDKGILNATHYRRISLLASSVLLERFTRLNIANKAADIKRWRAKERNYRWFVDRVKFGHESQLETVGDYLRFMAFGSPKLRYLCGVVKDVVIDSKEKLLIFVEWPLTQWFIEIVCPLMILLCSLD